MLIDKILYFDFSEIFTVVVVSIKITTSGEMLGNVMH